MHITLSQLIFFLSFFSLFFLIVIFGETPTGILLMGATTLLLFLYQRQIKNISSLSIVFITLYLLVLAAAIFSSITTISLPLTIHEILFLLFGFICFFFFSTVDQKWLSDELVIFGIFTSGIVSGILSLLLTLFPSFATNLPAINLLVATYGHNHFATFLIILIPISWKFWQDKHSTLRFLLLLILSSSLLFTFARGAILLGLFELTVLALSCRNTLQLSRLKKSLLFAPLILGLILSIGLTFAPSFLKNTQCVVPFFQYQLCKPLIKEDRPAYWSQAISAVKAKPLTGWGPGSFTILSKKFAEDPSNKYSMYAHNAFLQALAEYGIFGGGALILFCFFILIHSLPIIFSSKSSYQKALSLGLVCLILDALYDYNWEYVSIWMLLLISLALTSKVSLSQYKKVQKFQTTLKFIWQLSCLAMITWSIFYVVSTLIWISGKSDLSLRIFPFVSWRVEQAIDKHAISTETELQLLRLYSQDAIIIRKQLDSQAPPQLQRQRLEQLIFLDPWNTSDHLALLQLLIKQKEWGLYVTQLEKFSQFVDTKWLMVPEAIRTAVLTDGTTVAGELLPSDVALARRIYISLYRLYPMTIDEYHFDLLVHPQAYPAEEVTLFLKELKADANLQHYSQTLTEWHWKQAKIQKNWTIATEFTLHQLEINPTLVWDVWESSNDTAYDQFQSAHTQSDLEQAQHILDAWYKTFQAAEIAANSHNPPTKVYDNQELLESHLLLADVYISEAAVEGLDGDTRSSKLKLAIKNFTSAKSILPTVIRDRAFFFESCTTDDCDWAFISAFIDETVSSNNSALIQDRGRPSMRILQRLINYEVGMGNWDSAEKYTKIFDQLFKYDYWASSQLGNLYYLQGQYDEATRAYKSCVELFSPNPEKRTDCFSGLLSIEQNLGKEQELYWQASENVLTR